MAAPKITVMDLARAAKLTPTPGQEAFIRVAFDGEMPDDSPESVALWGRKWKKKASATARKVAVAVAGRGSGKTLLGALRAIHLALTVDISMLRRREDAFCPIIAPDTATAEQTVRFAVGIAEDLNIRFTPYNYKGSTGLYIHRANGQRVLIATAAASRGGATVRGRSLVGAVMDELAFFRDEKSKINDADVYGAAHPRLMNGAQIVALSSPWMQLGLLYEMYKLNFGHPKNALVARAATSVMREGDPSARELLIKIAEERDIDPERVEREYDAGFMTSNATMYFDARAIGQAEKKPREQIIEPTKAVGGDFAFVRNSTAFVSVAFGAEKPGQPAILNIEAIEEHTPAGKTLKPSKVCESAVDFTKMAGCDEIVSDGHCRPFVQEALIEGGISLVNAPESNKGKQEMFSIFKELLHEGRVAFGPMVDPKLRDKLIVQMREVSSRPLAGGGVRLESPVWQTGEHGDLVSALVAATWRAYKLGWDVQEEREIPGNPDEHELRLMQEMREIEDRTLKLHRSLGFRAKYR